MRDVGIKEKYSMFERSGNIANKLLNIQIICSPISIIIRNTNLGKIEHLGHFARLYQTYLIAAVYGIAVCYQCVHIKMSCWPINYIIL